MLKRKHAQSFLREKGLDSGEAVGVGVWVEEDEVDGVLRDNAIEPRKDAEGDSGVGKLRFEGKKRLYLELQSKDKNKERKMG